MKAIVLGEEETVLGFSLIGVEGRVARNAREAAEELREVLASRDSLLLLVTESVAAWIGSAIAAAEARGAWIQVIGGPGGASWQDTREAEAELLSALGVKL